MRQFLQTYKTNYHLYIYCLIAFFIPLTSEFLPYLMLLWVLSGVLSIKRLNNYNWKKSIWFFLPAVFYFLHFIALFYSNDIDKALFDLEVKLSLLFTPLVILFVTPKIYEKRELIFKVFILGNLLASFICLVHALDQSFILSENHRILFEPSYWGDTRYMSFIELVNHRYSHFSYGYLSVFHHPTYFSIYILFSMVVLGRMVLIKKRQRYLWGGILLYFIIFLWLLASRAAYITFFVLLFMFLIKGAKVYLQRRTFISVMIVGIVSMIFAVTIITSSKEFKKYSSVLKEKKIPGDVDIRLGLWRASWEVFKDYPLFGTGTGDSQKLIHDKLFNYVQDYDYNQRFNAHNQYLDTAMKTGIIGLLILLVWLFGMIYLSIREGNNILLCFSVILLINFVFEVLFNKISGVSFVVFFYSLLNPDYSKSSMHSQTSSHTSLNQNK